MLSRAGLRLAAIFFAFATFLSLTLLSIHQLLLPTLAYLYPTLHSPFQDLAVYGLFPTATFRSSSHTPPTPNIIRWDDAACSDGYILASLNGPSVPHPGPSIFTPSGELVWHSDEYGVAMNLRLQTYNDSPVLTFWAGKKAATSGKGSYYILDQEYKLVRKIDAIGEGLFGDLHEFVITPENTAILTVYNTTTADLSGMGLFRSKESWVTDSLFQEIDLETGELLFQWSALDHFDPKETYMGQPFSGFSEDSGFDSFHINSVDKHTETGDYLVSSRHTHTISLISGDSGEVLWVLGGANNDFEDLSAEAEGGGATDFRWQHDARFLPTAALPRELRESGDNEEGVHYISLFDNQKAGPLHRDARQSRGLILRLDTRNEDAMTAEIIQTFTSTYGTLAGSQGSVQMLPAASPAGEEAKVVVGWGASAMYTQHSLLSGEVECEVHLAPSVTFSWERAKSYRVQKLPALSWVGRPGTKLDVKVTEGRVWVSWNGATEVRSWEVQGRPRARDGGLGEEGQEDWVQVSSAAKTGFETSLELPVGKADEQFTELRVVAVSALGAILSTSEVFESPARAMSRSRILLLCFAALLAAVAGLAAVWLIARAVLRRRHSAGRGYHLRQGSWVGLDWEKLSLDFANRDWSFEGLRDTPSSPKYRPL